MEEQACHQEQQCSSHTETVNMIVIIVLDDITVIIIIINIIIIISCNYQFLILVLCNVAQVVDTTTYEECEDVITKVCTNTQVITSVKAQKYSSS